MLTLWEGARGWDSDTSRDVRVIRSTFLGVTGLAVLLGAFWLRTPVEPVWLDGVVKTLALLDVTATAAVCVRFRLRNPLSSKTNKSVKSGELSTVGADIRQLADRLDRMVKTEQLYLDGDLKVADLGRRLQVPDHKITRAIIGALGSPNFNAYI